MDNIQVGAGTHRDRASVCAAVHVAHPASLGLSETDRIDLDEAKLIAE